MRTTMIPMVLLAMTGCATAGSNVKLHDPEVTQSLEQFVRGGFEAMDRGDMAYWKNSACPEAVMWDIDEKGTPFQAKGKEEIMKALDGFQKMMNEGTRISTTINSIECRSSSLSGHCLVDFDQTFTSPDGQSQTMKFRGTAIGEKLDNGKWIWAHWHGSMREAPEAAAANAPEPAQPAAPAAPAESSAATE